MKFIEKEERPWGLYYVIHDEKDYKLKRIEVNPNQRLSYQYHNRREESWTIVKGTGVVTINDKETEYTSLESTGIKDMWIQELELLEKDCKRII